MRTKKQKSKLIVIIVIFCVLILLAIFLGLYLLTDMFKSEKVLFSKYMVSGVSEINSGYKMWVEAEKYPDKIYKENIIAEIDFMENIGTSEENTENKMNDIELELKNSIDNINNYREYEFALYNYIESEDGEKIKDTLIEGENINNVNNYVTLENVTEKYFELNSEVLSEMLGEEFAKNLFNLNITEEEIMTIITKYIGIFYGELTDDMFSKSSNQNLEIGEKTYKANAYILSLTKEQYGEIQIKLLEELEKEELILSKIPTEELKESYKENIVDEIKNIRAENIGTEITTITVYENSGKTIAIAIKNKEQEQVLEMIQTELYANYEYIYKDLIEGTTIETIINQTSELKVIDYTSTTEEGEISMSYKEDIKGKENGKEYLSSIIYENNKTDEHHKVSINIDREIEFVDSIKKAEIEILDMEELDQEEYQTIGEGLAKIVEKFETAEIVTDFNSMMTTIFVDGEVIDLSPEGVTEAEKNRFNAQFELLTVEGADTEKLKEVISLTGQYISALDVVSNTELRVEIDRNNPDPGSKAILDNFLEIADSFEYVISLEYDDDTELVDAINLVIIEEE